jgi:hypothetical protein
MLSVYRGTRIGQRVDGNQAAGLTASAERRDGFAMVRRQGHQPPGLLSALQVAGAKSYHRFLARSELLEARRGHPVKLITTEALSPFIGPRILAAAQDVRRAA